MPPLRVIHLVQDMNVGGMERMIAALLTGFDPARVAPQLWCLTAGGPLADTVAAAGIPVQVFGFRRYLLPGNILRLARAVRRNRGEIIHAHGYGAGILGRIAARCAGCSATLRHFHTTETAGMLKRQIHLERLAARFLTTRVLACSAAVRQDVIDASFGTSAAVTVVHNGIAEDFAAPSGKAEMVRRNLHRTGGPVIVSVAALTAHKGHRFLLDALPAVLNRFPGTMAILVGSGPEEERLRHQARSLGIDGHIMFAGTQSDVRPYLECASAFVLPSLREGMGISIVEAMAKSLPVVASSCGGIPEVVVDGETGYLVQPGNAAALAANLCRIFADRAAAERLGKNGYARYTQQFTLNTMLTTVHRIYEESL